MSGTKIDTPEALARLDFAKLDGLLPVVVQDATTGDVLMLAFANREALEATLETGEMHFWSRSRGELWRKGDTSGNVLHVAALRADCDADTVLALVHPSGPACHTGERTCFGNVGGSTLARLDVTLTSRAESRPRGSYTVKLLDDPNLRLKKLGEEVAELVAALATSDRERAVEEAADLVYHALVGLRAEGASVRELLAALESRAGEP